MEYGKISAEQIRRIYMEETGQEIPGKLQFIILMN